MATNDTITIKKSDLTALIAGVVKEIKVGPKPVDMGVTTTKNTVKAVTEQEFQDFRSKMVEGFKNENFVDIYIDPILAQHIGKAFKVSVNGIGGYIPLGYKNDVTREKYRVVETIAEEIHRKLQNLRAHLNGESIIESPVYNDTKVSVATGNVKIA